MINIIDFGADPTGQSLSTQALQSALDAAGRQPGSEVLVPAGRFVTGTFYLRSHVTLRLEKGAVLLGSTDLDHYDLGNDLCRYDDETNKDLCLIYGEDLVNVSIVGEGMIDGQGTLDHFPNLQDHVPEKGVKTKKSHKGYFPDRPMGLRMKNCRNILLAGITIKDIPDWCCHFIHCDHLVVEGVTIDARTNFNTDGIDLDGCQNVVVRQSRFNCGDDVIAMQTSTDRPCRNILVTDCEISSDWAALRCGPLSVGNFENITMRDCLVHDTYGGGVKLSVNEGGEVRNLTVENVRMERVVYPVLMVMGDWHVSRVLPRGQHRGGGAIRNVVIRNVTGSVTADIPDTRKGPGIPECERKSAIVMAGMSAFPIDDVVLDKVSFTFPGGGTADDAARVPPAFGPGDVSLEQALGTVPAYALYARHVRNLTLNQVEYRLAAPDARPATVMDDVHLTPQSDPSPLEG